MKVRRHQGRRDHGENGNVNDGQLMTLPKIWRRKNDKTCGGMCEQTCDSSSIAT